MATWMSSTAEQRFSTGAFRPREQTVRLSVFRHVGPLQQKHSAAEPQPNLRRERSAFSGQLVVLGLTGASPASDEAEHDGGVCHFRHGDLECRRSTPTALRTALSPGFCAADAFHLVIE